MSVRSSCLTLLIFAPVTSVKQMAMLNILHLSFGVLVPQFLHTVKFCLNCPCSRIRGAEVLQCRQLK